MNPQIKEFLKDVLKDAGQTDLPENLEEQMLKDLNTRLEERLILVALEHLAPDKQQELEELSKNNADASSLENFVKENVPNWEKVFADALIEFRNLYISATNS